MSLHLQKMLNYFDQSEVLKMNYLSKQGLNKVIFKVLKVINETIPEIQLTLIDAIMSIAEYVNSRDVLMYMLTTLILNEDNSVK